MFTGRGIEMDSNYFTDEDSFKVLNSGLKRGGNMSASFPIESDSGIKSIRLNMVKTKAYKVTKRIFDIVFSIIALVLFSPLLLITAAAIKAEDGGPVIYKRYCVGKNYRHYIMYKFRSMRVDADNLEELLTPEQLEEYRNECKINNDPRITKVGRMIRRFSIDELPQLVSILKGDMSIIGPRPIVEFETKFYGKDIEKVLEVMPGLTGYWQVNGRSNATYESGRRQKLELYYVEHQSIKLDAEILCKTVKTVFAGEGAR